MSQTKAFDRGLLCGMLLMLAMKAFYWLIASWHPQVGLVRTLLVILEGVLCLLAAALLAWRTRRSRGDALQS